MRRCLQGGGSPSAILPSDSQGEPRDPEALSGGATPAHAARLFDLRVGGYRARFPRRSESACPPSLLGSLPRMIPKPKISARFRAECVLIAMETRKLNLSEGCRESGIQPASFRRVIAHPNNQSLLDRYDRIREGGRAVGDDPVAAFCERFQSPRWRAMHRD